MKIISSHEISKYVNEPAVTRTKKQPDEAHGPAGTPTEHREDATVNLSQRSKEVQKAQEAVHSLPDVRLEKVQVIKEKIEKGAYEIDPEETAEKMLNVFFDEII